MPFFDNLKGTSESSFKIGLDGIRIYKDQSTNPTSPTPQEGDLYFNTTIGKWMAYDSTRSKWLSVEAAFFQVGRSVNTAAGSYYRGINGATLSATKGYIAPFDGTVVAMGYTRSDTDSATFEVTAGGVSIAILASSAVKGKSTALNGDFNADDVLAMRNQSGGNTTGGVQAWFKVRWRT